MTIIGRRTPLSGTYVPPAPPTGIALELSPNPALVTQDSTVDVTVTLVRTNFTGEVTLGYSGAPAGVTISFAPPSLTGATLTSVATVTVALATALGDYSISISGSASGVDAAIAILSLSVAVTGPYEFLRPRAPDGSTINLPIGITFDPDTGDFVGGVQDTTAPTWGNTVALIDTGNAVTNMNDLNAAIATAAASAVTDTLITCAAVVTGLSGNIIFKNNVSGFTIGIYTANHANLPAESPGLAMGTYANRLSPANYPDCVPIWNPAGFSGSRWALCEDGAKKYRLRGIRCANPTADAPSVLLYIAPATAGSTDVTKYPTDFVISQCGLDMGDYQKGKRFAFVAGVRIAFKDCYGDNFGQGTGGDTQFIAFFNGPGPYTVHNCEWTLGGPSEGLICGGTTAPDITSNTFTSHDVDWRGNVSNKWDADPIGQKNDFEIKAAIRFLISGNVTGFHNGGGQSKRIVIKLSDQTSVNPFTDTVDGTIHNNYMPTGVPQVAGQAGQIHITGSEFTAGGASQALQTRKISAKNNLAISIYGPGFTMEGTRIEDINAEWNTFRGPSSGNQPSALSFTSTPAYAGLRKQTLTKARYNVLIAGQTPADPTYCVKTISNIKGSAAFSTCCTAYDFSENLVSDDSSVYDGNYKCDVIADMGLHDYANDELWLDPTSPGYQAGPDGQDIGYQKAVLDAIIFGKVIP